jgi:hypothetical protein
MRLVSRDLARVFEKLRPLRLPGAHGGAETRNQLKARVGEMYDLIREWDGITRRIWSEFVLVRGAASERFDDHYLQEVELIIGNDYPFARIKVSTHDAMKSGSLYMFCPSESDFMEIRAPLFEFMEVPDESKSACYYFNRLRGQDLDLKSFVYPGELSGDHVAPMIGKTVHWLLGDSEVLSS